MKLLTVALFAIAAQASAIQPGSVWSQYPFFAAPCDGLVEGPRLGDCIVGQIRTISDAGEVLTQQIQATHQTPEPTPPVIAWEPHVEAPVVSAVPEPSYTLILAGLFGLLVLVARTKPREWRSVRGDVFEVTK